MPQGLFWIDKRRLVMVLVALSLIGLTGCGGPQHVRSSQTGAPHMDGQFLDWRAGTLGVTRAVAEARENAMPAENGPPPYDQLDTAMAAEAARVWATACAACHGVDGHPPSTVQPKPRTWGTMGVAMGFFFGGDKMRSGIYRVISNGKGPHMPAWKDRLSREQIWALVRHIEGF